MKLRLKRENDQSLVAAGALDDAGLVMLGSPTAVRYGM